MNREVIEREIEQLSVVIAAAEPWAKQYSKDPDTHAAIIKCEAKLDRQLRSYFKGLAERVPNFINWQAYRQKVMKAYDVNVTFDETDTKPEDAELSQSIHDALITGITIGANAGENIYSTTLGLSRASDIIQKTAQKETAKLVTRVNDTTRNLIRRSISTSIQLGEDQASATDRLQEVVKNYDRAAMIARTEAVNAYSRGLLVFGDESGATGKEWQALSGACVICAPLDGKVIGINDDFSEGVGDAPPSHVNCRCGLRLLYSNEYPAK